MLLLLYCDMTPESRNSGTRDDSVNRFPQQRIRNQQWMYCWDITTETVLSVGSAPRLYNENPRLAGVIIGGVSRDGSRRWQRTDGNELVELQECGSEKTTSCALQREWYNYCVEIRCQDTISEDWEPQCLYNGELLSVRISDCAVLIVVTSWMYKCNESNHPIQTPPNSQPYTWQYVENICLER
jgi:hypothetical protein